eukprot:jgi/Tetstr1/423181/TSEL_001302.t1
MRLGNGAANSAFRAPWAPGAMPLSQWHISPSGAPSGALPPSVFRPEGHRPAGLADPSPSGSHVARGQRPTDLSPADRAASAVGPAMLGAPEDPSHAAEPEPMEPGDYFTRMNQEYTDDEDDAAAKASEQADNSGEAHPPAPGAVRVRCCVPMCRMVQSPLWTNIPATEGCSQHRCKVCHGHFYPPCSYHYYGAEEMDHCGCGSTNTAILAGVGASQASGAPPAPPSTWAYTDHDMDSDNGFLEEKLIMLGKTRGMIDDKRGCLSPWELIASIFCDPTFMSNNYFMDDIKYGNTITKSVNPSVWTPGRSDDCLKTNFVRTRGVLTRRAPPKIQQAPSSNASISSNFWRAVTESLQKENMQPRSGAATNTLSTPEKERIMAKASTEKKKGMRHDQKLRHSEQLHEAEKGMRRKCDLISDIMRSDAAQLTEDNKASLRERIMSIMMHAD